MASLFFFFFIIICLPFKCIKLNMVLFISQSKLLVQPAESLLPGNQKSPTLPKFTNKNWKKEKKKKETTFNSNEQCSILCITPQETMSRLLEFHAPVIVRWECLTIMGLWKLSTDPNLYKHTTSVKGQWKFLFFYISDNFSLCPVKV